MATAGGAAAGELELLATELKQKFDTKHDLVKELAEKALSESQKNGDISKDLKEKADEALSGMNEIKARLDDMEQKAARGGSGDDRTKSLGQQFVDLEELAAMKSAPRSGASASLSVKADITTSTTNAAGSAGAAIAPNRLPGVLQIPQRRLTIRDLLSPGQTDSPSILYIQETGFTNSAAPTAEGALKPQSDLKLVDKNISTKVIAHWFRASKQILSDFSQIRSLIDERLIYGLQLVEENQLLNGDGTGENLEGLIPQATAYAAPAGLALPAPVTGIDILRIAMLQASLAEFPATGHVLNPIDWAGIELLKDTEGRYVIGNPQGSLGASLWNLPVVTTQSMTAGKFLTGAFRLGAQIFDQWASRIEVGFQNDDFVRNKVTILAEERLALAVYRPEAFIYGDVKPASGG
ncbi:phage major capsid protein [Paraburkholderia aspalathi]|nr:phage major capsid protein [Paraburkholderia aspalathi]